MICPFMLGRHGRSRLSRRSISGWRLASNEAGTALFQMERTSCFLQLMTGESPKQAPLIAFLSTEFDTGKTPSTESE